MVLDAIADVRLARSLIAVVRERWKSGVANGTEVAFINDAAGSRGPRAGIRW